MTPPSEKDSGERSWSVHLALACAQTGFALFPILGKLVLSSMPALVLASLRVVCAALLLGLLHRAFGRQRIAPRDHAALLLYGLLGVSLNQVLYILGLSLTTAINTTILTTTIPIFTLVAAVLLGREKMTFAAAAGVVLAAAGALILLDVRHFDWHGRNVQGNLLLLGNSVFYSFYLVLSRPILSRYSAATFIAYVFLYGTLPILLVAAPQLARFAPSRVTPISWISLTGVIVLCTVMPYFANAWALARARASRVAFYVFVQPLIASILAIIVLHERYDTSTAAAAALILGGLAVSMVEQAPRDRVRS